MNYKKPVADFPQPAGSRDTEYGGINGVPPPAMEPPLPGGLLAQCPRCGWQQALPFDVTLRAWDLLLHLVHSVTGVSRRELLRTGGRRPSDQLHQARACLVQCLLKVAGQDVARRWLALHGIETRRFKLFREVLLEGGAKTLLETLPSALPYDQQTQ